MSPHGIQQYCSYVFKVVERKVLRCTTHKSANYFGLETDYVCKIGWSIYLKRFYAWHLWLRRTLQQEQKYISLEASSSLLHCPKFSVAHKLVALPHAIYISHESGFQVDFMLSPTLRNTLKFSQIIVNCQLVGHNQVSYVQWEKLNQ